MVLLWVSGMMVITGGSFVFMVHICGAFGLGGIAICRFSDALGGAVCPFCESSSCFAHVFFVLAAHVGTGPA